jgi:hypothetical protein
MSLIFFKGYKDFVAKVIHKTKLLQVAQGLQESSL